MGEGEDRRIWENGIETCISRGRFLSVLVLALATVGLEVSVPFCVPPTVGLRTLPGAGAQGQCLRPARDVPLGGTRRLPSPEVQLP